MPDELKPEDLSASEEAARRERENDAAVEREMSRRSRRGFLVAGVSTLGALGGWEWLRTRRKESGTPWPLRRVLDTNEEIFP